MTVTIETTEDNKASRLMRKAILRELHCPPDDPDETATDKLEQVARSLVNKAALGDVTAIKEVLDRIDGKSLPGVLEVDDGPRQVNISWKPPDATLTS
jgi:hypothetical protein